MSLRIETPTYVHEYCIRCCVNSWWELDMKTRTHNGEGLIFREWVHIIRIILIYPVHSFPTSMESKSNVLWSHTCSSIIVRIKRCLFRQLIFKKRVNYCTKYGWEKGLHRGGRSYQTFFVMQYFVTSYAIYALLENEIYGEKSKSCRNNRLVPFLMWQIHSGGDKNINYVINTWHIILLKYLWTI